MEQSVKAELTNGLGMHVACLSVSGLDALRLAASSLGWDLDLEPGAPGRVSCTATRMAAKIVVTGSNNEEAAEKLIRLLMGDDGDN